MTDTPRIDAILHESGSWKDGIMTGLEVELADEGKKLERSLAAAQAALRDARPCVHMAYDTGVRVGFGYKVYGDLIERIDAAGDKP